MALQDFIRKLKEQDDSDVIYSKPPEQTIKIIPPTKPVDTIELPSESTKIIPPVIIEDTEKPKTIKFKIKVANSSEQRIIESPIVKPQEIIKPQPKPKVQTPVKSQVIQPKNDIEILFERSGTDISKKELWFDYYEKAKTSRKQNSIVERIRAGKFAITYDNQVLMLPDYDLYQKSVNEILQDKWLNQ